MRLRVLTRGLIAALGVSGLSALTGLASADPTNLQQTTPILDVILALSAGGAAITFGFLVYALWKFRDPATKRRRYG